MKRLCVPVVILTAACNGSSSTAPSAPSTQTVTATLQAGAGGSSFPTNAYPVTLTAHGMITVTVTDLTPMPPFGIGVGVWIGVPSASASAGCSEDIPNAVAILLTDPIVNNDVCSAATTLTCVGAIPAVLKRTSTTNGAFCVGVQNLSIGAETYTLTIATGSQ